MRQGVSALFYMNYVGCKVVAAGTALAGLTVFYMNYVGCKAIASKLEEFITDCFI